MYNNGVNNMKTKSKKGFTVIELAVTLAILGISFSLTAVVVVTLTSTQNKTNDLVLINQDIQSANDLIEEYVSFVSLKTTAEAQFSFNSCDENGVTFTNGDSLYNLKYLNGKILAKTEYYTEIAEILKFNKSLDIPRITGIDFSYSEGSSEYKPDMLIANFKTEKISEKHVYYLRVQ